MIVEGICKYGGKYKIFPISSHAICHEYGCYLNTYGKCNQGNMPSIQTTTLTGYVIKV